MGTIYIFIAIGVIIAIYQELRYGWADFIDYVIMSFAGACYGAFIGLIVSLMLPMQTKNKITSYEIECLQDNSSSKGSFFLGSGYIDGTMKYAFYYKDKNHFQLKLINYKYAAIEYTTGSPKVYESEVVATDSWINNFAFDFNLGDKYYVIQVPKGTIQSNFNLDAK